MSLLQLHDPRDIFLFCNQQPVVFENAGTWYPSALLFVALSIYPYERALPLTLVCVGMAVHRYLFERLRHGALLRHFNVRSPKCCVPFVEPFCYFLYLLFARVSQFVCLLRHHNISLMFVFGINKCRLFAFFFFGWKMNAVIK